MPNSTIGTAAIPDPHPHVLTASEVHHVRNRNENGYVCRFAVWLKDSP